MTPTDKSKCSLTVRVAVRLQQRVVTGKPELCYRWSLQLGVQPAGALVLQPDHRTLRHAPAVLQVEVGEAAAARQRRHAGVGNAPAVGQVQRAQCRQRRQREQPLGRQPACRQQRQLRQPRRARGQRGHACVADARAAAQRQARQRRQGSQRVQRAIADLAAVIQHDGLQVWATMLPADAAAHQQAECGAGRHLSNPCTPPGPAPADATAQTSDAARVQTAPHICLHPAPPWPVAVLRHAASQPPARRASNKKNRLQSELRPSCWRLDHRWHGANWHTRSCLSGCS
eukprot:352121-Chlamydomonas_euryale.AAC.2